MPPNISRVNELHHWNPEVLSKIHRSEGKHFKNRKTKYTLENLKGNGTDNKVCHITGNN